MSNLHCLFKQAGRHLADEKGGIPGSSAVGFDFQPRSDRYWWGLAPGTGGRHQSRGDQPSLSLTDLPKSNLSLII